MNFLYFKADLPGVKREIKRYIDDNNESFQVPVPWYFVKNKILAKICHVHLSSSVNARIHLPFKRIWFNYIFSQIKFKRENEKLCIRISAHLWAFGDKEFIKYVKEKYPCAKIIFVLSDKYEYYASDYQKFPKPNELLSLYDKVISFNHYDVAQYGFIKNRYSFNFLNKTTKNEMPYSDLFFIGQNKNRLPILLHIYEIAKRNNLKCEFFIINVDEKEQQFKDDIHYNQSIPYEDVKKYVEHTNCVVNILQENSSGITMRDYEALFYNKFLLTNNPTITETEFYSREQVILLPEIEERINEIQHPNFNSQSLVAKYNEENYYKWLELLLFPKEKDEK